MNGETERVLASGSLMNHYAEFGVHFLHDVYIYWFMSVSLCPLLLGTLLKSKGLLSS